MKRILVEAGKILFVGVLSVGVSLLVTQRSAYKESWLVITSNQLDDGDRVLATEIVDLGKNVAFSSVLLSTLIATGGMIACRPFAEDSRKITIDKDQYHLYNSWLASVIDDHPYAATVQKGVGVDADKSTTSI